jgi:hypothetical protein
VEEEGAKDFADFEVTVASKSSKKRKLTEADGGEEGGEDLDGDNSTEGAGALSEFVRGRVRGLGGGREGVDDGRGTGIAGETGETGGTGGTGGTMETAQTAQTQGKKLPPSERDMVEVCGRQICRAWLKHTYLSLGQPCTNAAPEGCPRKHAITCSPEALYKDYSFKGLSKGQKKSIFARVSAEVGGSVQNP